MEVIRPLTFTILSVVSICSFASSETSEDSGLLDWLSNKSVEIRRSFSGSVKEAGAPATISVVNDSDNDDFYSIDLAIRAGEFGSWDSKNWQGRFFPIIEHHKNTKTNSRVDKSEISIGAEAEYSLGSCSSPNGAPIPFCRSLLFDARFRLVRDSENDKTTRAISVLAAPFGVHAGWPGSDFVTENGESFFYWLPSIGLQAYQSLPIERKIDGESVLIAPSIDEVFAVGRLNAEFSPFADRLSGRLALVFEYTHYNLIGSSDFLDDSQDNLVLSLDYFLDSKKRVGIGLKYENGESPTRNFLDSEIITFGLSLRI